MILLCVGLSHNTAPIEVRESLAIVDDWLGAALKDLMSYVKTGVIISTCNRTEVYSVVGHEGSGAQNIIRFLADHHNCSVDHFSPYLYIYSQRDVVRHLFRVASGLDSMILGENQILGQVKDAYKTALSLKVTGPILSKLFSHALRMGKRTRQQTSINRKDVSISSAAVEFAKNKLGSLDNCRVLIIGAGQTSELIGKALVKSFGCDTVIASRTYPRARQLAREIGGRAIPFDKLPEALAMVDLVISSTDSQTFILERPTVENAMGARNGRPLLLIDIAVPRDIHPEVGKVGNVSLRDIDELEELAALNRKDREEAAAKAEAMVDVEADKFMAWWDAQEVVPTIKALRVKAELIRSRELDRTLRRLKGLSQEERQRVEALTSAIVNKMLHDPLVRLKERADGHNYVKVMRELFQIQESIPPD